MEYEKIRQLINDMGNSKLTSVDIEFPDGVKIKMEKKVSAMPFNEQVKVIEHIEENTVKEEVKSGNIVKSPMVGTFYIKPSPSANPYVEIGKQVKKGDTLCIIEAMKLMNEIESEFSGKIIEVLVKDGDTVEYGTPLFKIAVSEV